MDRRGLVAAAAMLLAMFGGVAVLAPGEEPVRWNVLGDGSWQGVRTAKGGNEIIIVLIGGPEYDVANPCSDAYHVRVTESDAEVRVLIGSSSPRDRRPPLPEGSGYGCTAEGHHRVVRAELSRPVGSRLLIDEQFDRRQPFFDGDLLAVPTWMPPGWHLQTEGPGPPDQARTMITSWTRSYGPERPTPQGDHCVPADPGVALTQWPGLKFSPADGEHYDVRGATAVYSLPRATWPAALLSWQERGQRFDLGSSPNCDRGYLTSKETMLQFARSLAVP